MSSPPVAIPAVRLVPSSRYRHPGDVIRLISAALLLAVSLRTLLAIAALAGAFYYLLPELAQVGSSWHALQAAHWIWLPVVIAFSALTYLASAISLLGSVTVRLPFWPTALTQGASSFINRVSQVGAVYLVASLIAAASPTPGGLGAIEAAAIAGLTGIGISSGPAVSAVLVYRLATYWLPVLPGWYSWRLLQRMDYL
jgi:hypothetical protein